jgi:hypothetical protein
LRPTAILSTQKTPILADDLDTAAEAFSAIIGCVDNGESISPELRQVTDVAIVNLLNYARNLCASLFNVDDDDIDDEQLLPGDLRFFSSLYPRFHIIKPVIRIGFANRD